MSEGAAIKRQGGVATADVETTLRAWGDLVACSEGAAEPRTGETPRVLRLRPRRGALHGSIPGLRDRLEALRAAHHAWPAMPLILVVDLRDLALPSLLLQTEVLRVILAAARDWQGEREGGTDGAEEEEVGRGDSRSTTDAPIGQIRGVLIVSDGIVVRKLFGAILTVVRRRSSSLRLAISDESPATDADAVAHLA